MSLEEKPIDTDALAVGIAAGHVTVSKPPKSVYKLNHNKLLNGLYKGIGITWNEIDYNSPDYALLRNLRENTYIFSAAKTFQQTREMTAALTQGDKVVPLSEFKQIVAQISDQYNVNWLNTEYNTAIAQAQNASSWQRFEQQLSVLPLLEYDTVGDACAICAPLNGTILPVNDPFWNTFMPENHFNCRCVVVQREDGEVTEASTVDERSKEVGDLMSDVFKQNVGKTDNPFGNDHPYYDVPDKYKELAANNFNLPIPAKDE
jgi:SPP1 gp7 family putative phage head morphogenesis protein